MKLPEIVSWKSDSSNLIRNCEYLKVLEAFYKKVPDVGNGAAWSDQLNVFLETVDLEVKEEALLCVGIAALGLFIQSHWTGPPLDHGTIALITPLKNQASSEEICKNLVVDETVLTPVQYPELVSFALEVFKFSFDLHGNTPVTNLWRMRGFFIQQQILDEISPVIYDKVLSCMEKLSEDFSKMPEYRLEKIRIFMYYMALELAQKEIDKTQEEMKFSYDLTGVLGKRTKFQQNDIPQMLCTTKSLLPQPQLIVDSDVTAVPFSDEVQLEHMLPSDSKVLADEQPLSSIEYALLLAAVKIRIKSMPKHITCNEENKAIVDRLFRGKGPWATTITASLLRMELADKREKNLAKALSQIEWVIQKIGEEAEKPTERLDCFFISYLPSINEMQIQQAEYYIFYHDYKMAIDIYEKLQKWQLVIECLMSMNERSRAEVLIREQLIKDPSNIPLLCYLGDVTENPEHYAEALKIWGKPSVRVHRHWGVHLFKIKKFEECIEHLEKSLELNRFQPGLWLKLGWSAIQVKNFKLGAKSYKEYCSLESDDREPWDNLAHCYHELGQYDKAIMILKESLKVDMSFWKTWDSLALIYVTTKQFNEALRSYEQALKLNPNYREVYILKGLFNAFKGNENPQKKNALISIFKETTRRISLPESEIFQMYAVLVKDTECELEALLEIHKKASAVANWEANDSSKMAVHYVLDQLLTLYINQGIRKELFKYIAIPSISAVLRYDPSDQNFLDLKSRLDDFLCVTNDNLSTLSL